MIPIDEQIAALRNLEGPLAKAAADSLEELKRIREVQVPDEPIELFSYREALKTGWKPFGVPVLAVFAKHIDTLRDLLRRESYLHQLDHSLADQWLKRAEAAESKLAAIESVQVPDEPTTCASGCNFVSRKDYDTLRDLLKQCKHNSGVTMDELAEMRDRADAAESKLAQIEKMGREPSDAMRDAGNEVILNRSNTLRAWRLMCAKMMEELK